MIPNIVQKHQHIIAFDGVCNLCDASINFIIKHDKHKVFKFASMQSETGITLLEWCQLPTNNYQTLIYIANGKALFKSQAVLDIAKLLPLPLSFLIIFKIIPKFIRDYSYDLIAKYRFKLFSRRSTCLIPSTEIRKRFI